MKHFLPVLFLWFVPLFCHAQQEVTGREIFGGYVLVIDNEAYSISEVIRQQERGSELHRTLRQARRNQGWSEFLSLFGGAVLGLALGDALFGPSEGEASLSTWEAYLIAGVSIGLVTPLNATAKRRFDQSLYLLNAGPPLGVARSSAVRLGIGPQQHGLGVSLQF